VTIDGETARDFDDAVYVERRERRWAGISKCTSRMFAHYVTYQDALDNERVCAVLGLFHRRAVPMLPESLSNGICSLNPREDRLVMSCLMEFDASGRMRDSRMTAGVIVGGAHDIHQTSTKCWKGDAEASARTHRLSIIFKNENLALLLNARRNEHGSIDFDYLNR